MKILWIGLLLLSSSVFAITPEELIRKSRKINRSIIREVNDLNARELSLISQNLDIIKKILRNSSQGDFNREACIDYTYQIYYRSLSSSEAMDKATFACRRYKEMKVLKILYTYAYKSLNGLDAINLAIRYSGMDARKKAPMAAFLVEKHYKSLGGADSAIKAGMGIVKLEEGSLGCLQKAYERYYRDLSSSDAASAAARSCSGQEYDR